MAEDLSDQQTMADYEARRRTRRLVGVLVAVALLVVLAALHVTGIVGG
jgi:hypothetical protein